MKNKKLYYILIITLIIVFSYLVGMFRSAFVKMEPKPSQKIISTPIVTMPIYENGIILPSIYLPVELRINAPSITDLGKDYYCVAEQKQNIISTLKEYHEQSASRIDCSKLVREDYDKCKNGCLKQSNDSAVSNECISKCSESCGSSGCGKKSLINQCDRIEKNVNSIVNDFEELLNQYCQNSEKQFKSIELLLIK